MPQARVVGRRRAAAAAIAAGEQISGARRRRRWSQQRLASMIGISQARASQIERGQRRPSPEVCFALSEALGIPFRYEFGRDQLDELADAGHLQMQELVLRLSRPAGFSGSFELPTRPQSPAYSVDVCLRDDARRLLVLVECWNTFGNIGASVRSTRRKMAEAEALAVAIGGDEGAYRVEACWVVRDSIRNREILGRYPEMFGSTFAGSSAGWARALTTAGGEPPSGIGLLWCDLRAGQLRAWRRARG